MTRKRNAPPQHPAPPHAPRAYVAALPLSALPELREILAPLMGAEGRRGTVVMMRLADEPLARIDRLVEGGLFGSRSEAAAFLVGAGIESQSDLFQGIERHAAELQRLRQSLRDAALDSLRRRVAAPKPARPAKPAAARTRRGSSRRSP
jgi:Arc/MetJ-type ribon-helix-helix transcriptional regulator